jgi:hypothetical protein
MPHMEDRPNLLENAFQYACREFKLKKGERVVITAGLPIRSPGTPTNVIQVREII